MTPSHTCSYQSCIPSDDVSASTDSSQQLEDFLDDGSHIIEYLFTDPYYRQCGYGGQLLEAMEDYCVSVVSLLLGFKIS